MIKEAIHMLVGNIDLSQEEMASSMNEIMEGKATDAQIGAFLTALRCKGESVSEITGAAKVMRQKASRISCPEGTLDTCGTGGDMSGTFNISTMNAILVSACGVPVAKHGNRSVSSKSGSADVLEALGVKIDLEPQKVEKCLAETGFGFLFAPLFHPAMKFAIGPRREMAIRTIFNILGPITNPAGAGRQLLGVFSNKLTSTLAEVLGNLGAVDAMVVHGEDGLDEITVTDGTMVSRCRDGKVEDSIISPEDFGFERATLTDIAGGDADENAKIALDVFGGQKGPKRDVLLMNAGASLLVAGKAGTLREGAQLGAEAIDTGAALKQLENIKKFANSA